MSLHRATVRLCYYAEQFPERCQRELMPSILDPFLPYLEQRHQEGCENALQLWREMKAMGYPGSRRQVSKWMQKQRAEPAPSTPRKYLKTKPAPSPLASKERSEAGNKERLPSVKQLAWLLVRDSDTLTEQEAATLKRIRQEPVIEKVYALAQRFVSMVRQRVVTMLDSWLDACHDSEIANLQTFAAGIRQDYQAVRAALETAWSNGQTEGQINRLKMLKRQMYGRANFDLLRKRMLGLPVVAPCQRPP